MHGMIIPLISHSILILLQKLSAILNSTPVPYFYIEKNLKWKIYGVVSTCTSLVICDAIYVKYYSYSFASCVICHLLTYFRFIFVEKTYFLFDQITSVNSIVINHF